MGDGIVTHMIEQGLFNDKVTKIVTSQLKTNRVFTGLIVACGVCLYLNNKQISKLTEELKELKKTKGV